MVLISQKFPNFIAPAILSTGEIVQNFNFQDYIEGKSAILFFWPMDFTFVCPTELIAFNNLYTEFEDRNVLIVGVSIDSVYTHNAWRNTLPKNGGVGKIKYPMISDITKKIQQSYGVEHPSLSVSLRASFLIDERGIIRHQSINDLPIGRNITDLIRIVDAWQFHERYGEVCPANWNVGKNGFHPTPEGTNKYLEDNWKNI